MNLHSPQSVTDKANANFGFKDGANVTTEYTYDVNGNMLSDANKGISAITYNHLNLPKSISIDGKSIGYTYDAAGIKLSKTANGKTIEYSSSTVYKDGNLELIYTPEGYMEPQGEDDFRYVYRLQDHLGNTRVSFFKNQTTGKVHVLNTDVVNYQTFKSAMSFKDFYNYGKHFLR